jgi:hypothetical protein
MGPNEAAAALARWLDQPDLECEASGDPYEHVVARADAIAAFALSLRNASPERWRSHDLHTLDKMYSELVESADRAKAMAVAVAAEWLEQRKTADPAVLLAKLAEADRRFGRLLPSPDELQMLRGERGFEATRVVAALALRCGALGDEQCDEPLSAAYASTLDSKFDAIKSALKRYRVKK